MFLSMRIKQFVVAACLLCGALVGSTAFAGPIQFSEITGQYQDATLISEGQFGNLPMTFSLSVGSVNGPPNLSGFSVPNESVTVPKPNPPPSPTSPPSLSTYAFNLVLTGSSPLESVDFSISPSSVSVSGAGSDFIDADMTLISNNNTGLNLSNFASALLTLDFSLTGVNFDANWPATFTGPVPFRITPLPEPASIIHLSWIGVLGAIGYWRRYRRKNEG